jgi:hypothetical protein
MRKPIIILGTLIFSIILISLIMNFPLVQAFNKNGPTPIPGNLFPHPNTSDHNHNSKHVSLVRSTVDQETHSSIFSVSF